MAGGATLSTPPTSCGSEERAPSPHSTRGSLLGEIEAFIRDSGMSEDRFGRRAVGSSKLISRLRAGKDITTANLDKITAFMAAERAKRAGLRPKGATAPPAGPKPLRRGEGPQAGGGSAA